MNNFVLTGKQNHTVYALHKEIPIEKSLKYLETIEGACDSTRMVLVEQQAR